MEWPNSENCIYLPQATTKSKAKVALAKPNPNSTLAYHKMNAVLHSYILCTIVLIELLSIQLLRTRLSTLRRLPSRVPRARLNARSVLPPPSTCPRLSDLLVSPSTLASPSPMLPVWTNTASFANLLTPRPQ